MSSRTNTGASRRSRGSSGGGGSGCLVNAYARFKDTPGTTRVATQEEIHAKDANLSIPLIVYAALLTALHSWPESTQRTPESLWKIFELS